MTETTFTTSQGARGRTRTVRRYAVVDARDGAVEYRTDDMARARGRRNRLGTLHRDIVDAHEGTILVRSGMAEALDKWAAMTADGIRVEVAELRRFGADATADKAKAAWEAANGTLGTWTR